MSAQHTPGPWRAERTPASTYWDWTVMAASGKGRTMQIGIDTDNTEADARLIAAAPELLEALRELMRNFPTDRDLKEAGWDDLEIETACQAYDRARAVIAKAQGSAS